MLMFKNAAVATGVVDAVNLVIKYFVSIRLIP